MSAAVWSVPNAHVLDFPIQMLVRFWQNHHLLDILQRPLWRVIKGRSESYVKRALESIPDVRVGTQVTAVTSTGLEGTKPWFSTPHVAATQGSHIVLT
jgi:cyclopropane-fatty-acyl-phospholipid synthase